ncbi:MAG: right-handed parallel beta-helix repeat-containing protein [Chitinophagaceae bacterium]
MFKSIRRFGWFVLFIFSNRLFAQDTIRISDFGYEPGSRINAVPFVQRAIEACKKLANPVLVFPKGRYDFWPEYCDEKKYYESNTDVIPFRRCPILLQQMQKMVFDGMGSEFVFHDRMQPLTIDSSQHIIIKNISIDWDLPLIAQAKIEAVTDQYIDISINVLESPYVIENGKVFFVGEGWKSRMSDWGIMEFDKDTKLIAPQTGDESCLGAGYDKYMAENIRYGLIRLNYNFKRKPALGNYLVLRHSARDHAGVFVVNSKDVSVENVNVYHTAGLGILSQYSENLSFRNVQCVPNAAKQRIFSGHDDGLHFSNCKGKIVVDSCRFLALMDDPINVHGTSVRVMKKLNDRTVLCKFMHEQSIGFTWAGKGDTVGFIENNSMRTFANGVVQSFKPIDSTLFELTFAETLPAALIVGNAVENLAWTPDVIIRNSFFGSNRARGILVTTPGKVLIENNVFESSGSAILISGDANGWYESGAVKDVTIRNNSFNEPCMTSMYQFCEGIISIFPEIPKPDSTKPFHKNIHIENNTFHPFDYPVLYAKSTDGLFFVNNTIVRSNRFQPFHHRKDMITTAYCKNVQIAGNTMQGEVLGKNIRLVSMRASELKLAPKQGIVVSK